jgi:flagellar motor switch protein FliG
MPAMVGPQRAAIALLAIDEDLAAQVLARMAEPDVVRLVDAVNQLDDVDTAVIEAVLEQLERGIGSPLAIVRTGGARYVRKLADRAFGVEKAQKFFGVPEPTAPDTLSQLRTARANSLAQILVEEHPQIAAVVLTQLPAGMVAKVLALVPPIVAADLASRISELEEVPEHAVAEASESLVRALEAAGGLATSDVRAEFDGLAFTAAIVNQMTAAAGDGLLGEIAARDEQAANRIREALFTFEDLARIAPRELGGLLRSVQSDVLVTALQTATSELRAHFMSGLSQRAAATLADDLSSAAPKRLSEVENAQREVVESAMKLAASGKLTLPPRGEE